MIRGRSCRVDGLGVLVAGLGVAALLVTGVSSAGTDGGGFGDLADAGVHEGAIEALVVEGVLVGTGCETDRFCPREQLPRWMMAVWLVRALDGVDPVPLSVSGFGDVDAGVWWAPHVGRLAEMGVTKGCAAEPAMFCPDDPVTRAQMATFLVRAFGIGWAPSAGFADTAGNVHEPSIDAVAGARITAGCATAPLRYCPQTATTKAQMATFLARALMLLPRPQPPPTPVSTAGLIAYAAPSPTSLNFNVGSDKLPPAWRGETSRFLTWLPDGSLLFYINRDDDNDIVVADLGNKRADQLVDSDFTNLTLNVDGIVTFRGVTPDGSRMVYSHDSAVFVVGTDGTGTRKITDFDDVGIDPSRYWKSQLHLSPDGTHIAVGPANADGDIFVVAVDGTDVRQLTDNRSVNFLYGWSPDGRRIAYSGRLHRTPYIYVVNSDGTQPRQVTDSGYYPSFDGWSPDSSRLIYSDDRGLFVVDIDGTRTRKLADKPSGHGLRSRGWSPDNDHIAYRRFGDGKDGKAELFVVDTNGYTTRQLTTTSSASIDSWSPDGTQILYSEDSGIFIVNVDGTNTRRLATYPDTRIDHDFIGWSPDGSLVAYILNPSSFRTQLNVFSTGAIQEGVTDSKNYKPYFGGWSPLGTAIAYNIKISDGYQLAITSGKQDREIFLTDVEGTNIRQLTDNTFDEAGPLWSPDGTRIVFGCAIDVRYLRDPDKSRWNDLCVVDADGSNYRQLTKVPDNPSPYYGTYGVCCPTWSVDGTRIAYRQLIPSDDPVFSDGNPEVGSALARIRIMDSDGNNKKHLTQTGDDLPERGHILNDFAPSWSPDGSNIAFTRCDYEPVCSSLYHARCTGR